MRGVPVLFEGVAFRAATLRQNERKTCVVRCLSGPGLSNALANLHNACRARVPLVNLVAITPRIITLRRTADGDIEMLARNISRWIDVAVVFRSSAKTGRCIAAATRAHGHRELILRLTRLGAKTAPSLLFP